MLLEFKEANKSDSLALKSFEIVELSIPLKTDFSITGSSQSEYRGCFVKLMDGDGRVGVGECCPLKGATLDTLSENIEFLPKRCAQWVGLSVDDAMLLMDNEWKHEFGMHFNAGMCSLEMAILDLKSQQMGVSFASILLTLAGVKIAGGAIEFPQNPQVFLCDITIPALEIKETREFLASILDHGFMSFKVKVTGIDLSKDFDRVMLTKSLIPKDAQLTLDGNQGFTSRSAVTFIKMLTDAGVSVTLFEQPLLRDDWKGFFELAKVLPCPICLDESVKCLADLERALQLGVHFWLNLKIMKSGIRETFLLGLMAKKNGIPLMIGGMVESDVSMTCSLHVLQALGGAEIVDLDTPFFMHELICKNSTYAKKTNVLDAPSFLALGLGLKYQEKFLGNC
jgi:L-Ala-D/L-Glu epimerase